MEANQVTQWADRFDSLNERIGWHRHITLSMLALAFLAAVRAEVNQPGEKGASHSGNAGAADGAGDSPAADRNRLATSGHPRARIDLVSLASPPSSHRATRPPSGKSPKPVCATVVIEHAN